MIIESIDAPAFVDYLTSNFEEQILALKMSPSTECNLQRFMLMLMPFISASSLGLPDKDVDSSKNALQKIYDLLRKIEKNENAMNYLL